MKAQKELVWNELRCQSNVRAAIQVCPIKMHCKPFCGIDSTPYAVELNVILQRSNSCLQARGITETVNMLHEKLFSACCSLVRVPRAALPSEHASQRRILSCLCETSWEPHTSICQLPCKPFFEILSQLCTLLVRKALLRSSGCLQG